MHSDTTGPPALSGEEDVGNWVLLAQASQAALGIYWNLMGFAVLTPLQELKIPFVASGGTATGVQLAAALAMGSSESNVPSFARILHGHRRATQCT